MIVLSRRRHESVLIGDDITILVVDTGADAVRLAIDAPKNVAVKVREKFETYQGQLVRDEESKRRAPAMTIGQRLRAAIGASGQGLDRLALQLRLPEETLDSFVRRNEDLPLSIVQRLASHFRLQLTGPDGDQSAGA
ncbi:MAG TPA: carbon storage regulator [Pirellulales bacterium]|jgi:carbon storage regulator|nr:carbon storage regulator [Pirellulales bacterium]